MSNLIRQHSGGPITAPVLVEQLFSERCFHEIEAGVLRAREAFTVPITVASKQQVIAELYRYHAHLNNWFSTIITEPGKTGLVRSAPDVAMLDLRRWYKHDLDEAIRNVLFNRHGGLIGVIDAITQGLLEEKKNAYFELVFLECIPQEQHARLRLAEELVARYGQHLDPDDPERRLPALMAGQIEQVIKAFVLHLHAMRKLTQW